MYDIVDKALRSPGKCILSGDTDGPFIDTGIQSDSITPYVYLHVPVVEYIAREKLGMLTRAEVVEMMTELREEIEEKSALTAEVVDLVGRLKEVAA